MAAPKMFVAKNEVHITETPGKAGDKAKGIPAKAPQVAVIPAKGKFMIDPDSDTCKELLARGVISPAKDEATAAEIQKIGTKKPAAKKPAAKKPAAKPAAEPAAEPADAGDGDGTDMV